MRLRRVLLCGGGDGGGIKDVFEDTGSQPGGDCRSDYPGLQGDGRFHRGGLLPGGPGRPPCGPGGPKLLCRRARGCGKLPLRQPDCQRRPPHRGPGHPPWVRLSVGERPLCPPLPEKRPGVHRPGAGEHGAAGGQGGAEGAGAGYRPCGYPRHQGSFRPSGGPKGSEKNGLPGDAQGLRRGRGPRYPPGAPGR